MHFSAGPLSSLTVDLHFSLGFFLMIMQMPVHAFSVGLHIPCHIQLQVDFDFPNPIPTFLNTISLFIQRHLPLLPHLAHFFFMSEFSKEFFSHACRLPDTFVCCKLIGIDHSWAWCRRLLKINHLSSLQGHIPCGSYKQISRQTSVFPSEEQSCTLALAQLSSCRALITWPVSAAKGAPDIHIPSWSFLVCKYGFQNTTSHLFLSKFLRKFSTVLSCNLLVCLCPTLWSFLQLSEKWIIYFFLIRNLPHCHPC